MLQQIVRATSSLLLCAALFACSSNGGQSTSETVTPSEFKVEGFDPFTLALSWQPPTATFDGYRLEFTDGSGPLQQIGTELIPPTERGIRLRSQTGIPEAVHLRFALSAIRQGRPIGPAATLDFIAPILPVWNLGAVLVDGGILLTWSSSSLRAETVEIVRVHLETADAGRPDPGFPVVQQASSTRYLDVVDQMLAEGSNFQYSVIQHGASTVSSPTTVQASVPLLSPTELLVTGRAGGVDLSWKSPSLAATELVLERGDGFTNNYLELVRLPADAGSYRDVPPSPGVYSYLLEAMRPGSQPGWLADSGVAPPRGDLLFDSAILDGPIGSTAVRDAAGRWTVCGGGDGVADLTGERTAFLPQGLRYWVAPCVLLDSAGLPHAIYGTAPTNLSSETLRHAWFDGTRWQSEEIATRASGFGYPAFALDAAGRVHVVWQQWGMPPDQGFEYAHRTAAGWSTETPRLPLTPAEFIWDLQVDPSGTVHVLMAPDLDLLERAPGGAWSNALIPVGPSDGGSAPFPGYGQLRLRGNSDLTVLFVRNGIEVATRRDGAWSAPEAVAPHLMSFSLPVFVAAIERGGGRLAVAFESSDQQTLLIQGPGGSLHVNLGGTEPYVAGLSFDADGGLHGLQYLSNILPGRADWLHYGTFDEVQPSP